jgi:hypothetical protein
MCYTAGPRCQGHAIERRDALKTKASKEWNKVREAENAIEELAKKDPAGYRETKSFERLETKRAGLMDKWKATGNELQAAESEIDATKGGIAELGSKLAQAKATAKTSEDDMHVANLQARYDSGRDKYRVKALAYDKAHGTVDCRKPSPYGTKEGVQLLNERAQKAIDKAKAATSEAEADKHRKEASKVIDQLKHARMTRDYVKRGIADDSRSSLATDKIELAKLDKEYNTTYAANKEWRMNWENGDYKKLQDFRKEALLKATRSRWTKATKEEEQRLIQHAEAARYNPATRGVNMMELQKKRDSLKARVGWAQKTDEERAETVRRNNAIAADYGKGPGSWTGD